MENKFESQQYSFQNSFGNLRLVAPNMVGGFLQQNTVISIHKSYYVYNEKTGLWTKFEDEEVKKEIFELLSEEEKQAWTPTVKNNVMELLSVMTKRFNNIPEQKGNWFCLNNCVVNLDTGKAKKFSSNFFFTGKTTYDFVRGAKCPRFEEYLDTEKLVKDVRFTQLFTYIYSKRNGTKAATMEDNVSHKEKSEWINRLIKIQQEIVFDHLNSFIGKEVRALVEEKHENIYTARTENTFVVKFTSDKDFTDKFVKLKITGKKGTSLTAELSDNN